MTRYFTLFFLLILANTSLSSQNAQWNTYSSYYDTQFVEDAGENLYIVASGSLLMYDKEFQSYHPINRTNGLSDTEIKHIKYNSSLGQLLITYENSNIDIISDQQTYNIPYIKDETSIQDKTIYNIKNIGNYAYISAAYGITVLDLVKKEIKETYILDTHTYDTQIIGEAIYAATNNGILQAKTTDNLLDKTNWTTSQLNNSIIDSQLIRKLETLDTNLIAIIPQKGAYQLNNNSTIRPIIENSNTITAKNIENKVALITSNATYIITDADSYETIKTSAADISPSKETFWLALKTDGAIQIQKNQEGQYQQIGENIKLNSPRTNSAYQLIMKQDTLYAVAGGKTNNGFGFNTEGIIMKFDLSTWTHVDQQTTNQQSLEYMKDYTSIAIDPQNPQTAYTSSFGYGLLKLESDIPQKIFNSQNSIIQSALPSQPYYDRIDGLNFDKDGNLWMTNSEAQIPIIVIDKDQQWHKIPNTHLANQYTLNNIFIDTNNQKWINIPRVDPSVTILDHNNTLEDTADDKSRTFKTFTDTDGNIISPTTITSITEDKEQYIWLGTNVGPLYITSPQNILDNPDPKVNRVKITNDNDELAYFMNNIKVTCMAVDEGNQIWFGTEANGVYALDNTKSRQLNHFDISNSPLQSNTIYSIATDNTNGIIYFGTDKGITSYKGIPTKPEEQLEKLEIYPNPVRTDIDTYVTIKGLTENARVKIVNTAGIPIYEASAIGGQIMWNTFASCSIQTTTGVYLVLVSDEKGERIAGKIMITNK